MKLFFISRWRTSIAALLINERGSLGVGMALSLVPVLALSLGSVLLTDFLARDTRIHAATCAAVLAVAKEGDTASGEARQDLLHAWATQNIQALKRPKDIPTLSLMREEDLETATSQTTPATDLDGKALKNFNNFVLTEEAVAERFYAPLELTIIFSAGIDKHTTKEGKLRAVRAVIEKAFETQRKPNDVRINIIPYSGYVNIGLDYADRLIIPESRKLTKVFSTIQVDEWGNVSGAEKTASSYAYQVKTLGENGLGHLVNNLLGRGGPADKYNMVGVARPPLAEYAEGAPVDAYVAAVEQPPASANQGFRLLMVDGRQIIEDNPRGIWEVKWNHNAGLLSYLDYGAKNKVQFFGDDVLDFAVLPKLDKNNKPFIVNSERKKPDKYLEWGTEKVPTPWGGTKEVIWGTFRDGVVALPPGIPQIPILIGSTSQAEAIEHLKQYKADTVGDAPDEGLAWALRSLSPNWSEMWDKGENFPAPWDSGVEKRVVFLEAGSITGYHGGWGGHPDVITPLCKRFKELGIQTNIVTLRPKWALWKLEKKYRFALEEGDDIRLANPGNLSDVLASLVNRQYRVRLTQAIPL